MYKKEVRVGQRHLVSNRQATLVKVRVSVCVFVYKTPPPGNKKAVCVTHAHVEVLQQGIGLKRSAQVWN